MSHVYMCFPQGKTKAFTLSYDDGKITDRKLIDIFNQYDLKATFHLNSAMFNKVEGHRYPYVSEEEIKSLYQGHEIASHTCSHPTLTRIPITNIVKEIVEDRMQLEKINNTIIRGVSYPNGEYNEQVERVVEQCGIAYARTTKNTYCFEMPSQFLRWHPTCHHKEALPYVEQFVHSTDSQRMQLLYVWGHSYEFDRDNNWQLIEQLAKLVAHKKDIWYATNIEIYDYLQAVQSLQFSANNEIVYNPSVINVWLNVNNTIIEIKGGSYVCLK